MRSNLLGKGMQARILDKLSPGNTKRGKITVTSCLTGLDKSVLKIKTKMVSCHTPDSKPVKQEVNGTVMLPPLVFPALANRTKPGSYFQL
jgi:hypothetical protein